MTMGKITETQLKNDLKAGKLARVYFLYGEEDFLVRTYADKIIAAAVPESAADMNFVKYSAAPRSDELSDHLESMPFFSEYKCVLIKDLDADALDNAEHKAYLSIIENIPETSVLIVSQENIEIDPKKVKAKMKKLMAACESGGISCEMKYLPVSKTAAMAQRKASGAGCALSGENAVFLAEECGNSLTELQNEVEKLCAYKGGGEINREDIEKLVPRRIDAGVYTLAAELFAGHADKAFEILDELFLQQIEPFMILAALSGHFTDLYRAKLGQLAKKTYPETAGAFNYPPNRSFAVKKAYGAVNKLSERYLASCIAVLYRTNKLLNSSKANKRTLIERAVAEIASL